MHVRKTVYKDNEFHIGCSYLNNKEQISLHLDISKNSWSYSCYKKLNKIFNNLVSKFKGEGYNKIYALPFKEDLKAQKLIKLFGFEIIRIIDNNVVMIYKIK